MRTHSLCCALMESEVVLEATSSVPAESSSAADQPAEHEKKDSAELDLSLKAEEKRKRRAERFGIELREAPVSSSRAKKVSERKKAEEAKDVKKRYKVAAPSTDPSLLAVSQLELTPEDLTRAAKRAKRFETSGETVEEATIEHATETEEVPEPTQEKQLVESQGPRRDAVGFPDTEQLRADAIYLHGVDEMSTDDVVSYFIDYGQRPDSIEWICDSSCVVIFQSAAAAKAALLDMTDSAGESVPAETADDAPVAWRTGRPIRRVIRVIPKKRKRGEKESILVDKPSSVSTTRADRLLSLRLATNADVRPPKEARKRSQYYAKLFGETPESGDGAGQSHRRQKDWVGQKVQLVVDNGASASRKQQNLKRRASLEAIQVSVTNEVALEHEAERARRPKLQLDSTRHQQLLNSIRRASAAHNAVATSNADLDAIVEADADADAATAPAASLESAGEQPTPAVASLLTESTDDKLTAAELAELEAFEDLDELPELQ